ncbi:hypothetical protein BMS3Bbin02_01759 [bacterium BMS3Bbin02]|nr:hypothetical protein BMS3Bbin02_01759 [bacterium BMS3Bbin02]
MLRDRSIKMARPIPSTTPATNPKKASRAVNKEASKMNPPSVLELRRCGGSSNSEMIAAILGMMRSFVAGITDPITGQSRWASSIDCPTALYPVYIRLNPTMNTTNTATRRMVARNRWARSYRRMSARMDAAVSGPSCTLSTTRTLPTCRYPLIAGMISSP